METSIVNCTSYPLPFPGLQRRTDKFGSHSPIFEERQPVIPRDQWRQIYDEFHPTGEPDVQAIHNQRNEGSCTANAAAQGYETTLVQTLGKQCWVRPSPISLYKRTGSSPSSGSTLSANVRELRDRGILPMRGEEDKLRRMGLDPSHVMPATGFSTPYPRGWEETAKHFRLSEYWDVGSIEGFVTALLTGFEVHYGRSGHSILGVAIVWRNNQWYVKYANSWGDWGENGFGYDSLSFISGSINGYGCFAYRSIVVSSALLKLAA